MAAAACAAGAFTATTVATSVTPWAGASAHVTSSVSAGQAGTGTVQLDARILPMPGASAPSNAGAQAQVVSPASDWALAFAIGKHASAVQAPVAHAAALQPPAAPAVSATATDQAKPARTPAVQPKASVAHPVPPKAAPVKAAPVRKAPAKVAPVHVAPAKPYFIYDSVTPTSIPAAGHQVAVYANGMYQASWSSVAGRSKVLWIDTKGNNPGANVLDVEPGDATPSGAVPWVKARLNAHQNRVAIVYAYLSAWQAVRANMATLPSWMQAKVRYWIADPTGVNHVVPGSNATRGTGASTTTSRRPTRASRPRDGLGVNDAGPSAHER